MGASGVSACGVLTKRVVKPPKQLHFVGPYIVVSQVATAPIFHDSGRELAMGDGKEGERMLDDGDAKEDSDMEVEPERLQYKVATKCFCEMHTIVLL